MATGWNYMNTPKIPANCKDKETDNSGNEIRKDGTAVNSNKMGEIL